MSGLPSLPHTIHDQPTTTHASMTRKALKEIYRTNVKPEERLICNAGACTAGEFALIVFLERHRNSKPVRSLQDFRASSRIN